jgi:hypothetical protein
VLLFNPDPEAPGGRPTRENPPDFPTSLANAQALDSDDIKAVTGIYDASLGARSNETSGRAIMARQREADVGTFDYVDNLSRAMKYQGEILVDLIPKVYDTERAIRILGEDGAEDYVKLNAEVYDTQTGRMVRVNDLSAAKFDVAITVGPSYTTQRMEQAEILMQLAQNPAIGPMVADLIVKSLDLPGAEEVENRLRKTLLAQGIIDPDPERGEQPPPPPPEGPPPEIALKQAELEGKMQLEMAKMQNDAAMAGQKMALDEQKLQLDAAKLQLDARKLEMETAKIAAEVAKIRAEASGAQSNAEGSRVAVEAAAAAADAARALQASIAEQSAMMVASIGAMQGMIQQRGGPRRIRLERGPDGRVAGAEVD